MLNAPLRAIINFATWPRAVALFVVWSLPAIALESSSEEIILESAERCEARLKAHLDLADSARTKANVLLVAGTALAALGSALAAFLKKEALRKTTGVAGALGALLAILPKTLADPAIFTALHAKAERHRDIAVKVHRQLGLVNPAKRSVLTQYVIARLADCESGDPPEKPPELALADNGVLLAIATVDQPKLVFGGRLDLPEEDWSDDLPFDDGQIEPAPVAVATRPRREDAIDERLLINWEGTVRTYKQAVRDQDWSRAVGALRNMSEYLGLDDIASVESRKQHWLELRQLAKLIPRRDLLPANLRPMDQ